MPHDDALANSVSSRTRHLRHFLFLTYLVTLLNTSGFLSAGGVVNFLTGINTLVIYLTYSLIYLLPAAILVGITDAILRWPIHRRRETSAAVVKKSWLIWTIAILATAATQIGLFADKEVFRLFGMHLNGFVWNTVFSTGGIESTGSGNSTIITYVVIIIAFLILYVAPAVNSLQVTALVSSAATIRRSKRLASIHRRLAR
ncbi:MAG: DUF3413 domain-containing protein [Planctomycetes bacterium]|nr:DUF3413 domain-containing protein [Planctomycetota bacterium]